jgi:MFS family permease
VGFGILGIGVSVIGPLGLALVGKSVPNHLRTEAISRVAVIGFSGFFLAPTLMGMVSEFHGLRVAFLCASALSLMVIPLILLLRRL